MYIYNYVNVCVYIYMCCEIIVCVLAVCVSHLVCGDINVSFKLFICEKVCITVNVFMFKCASESIVVCMRMCIHMRVYIIVYVYLYVYVCSFILTCFV